MSFDFGRELRRVIRVCPAVGYLFVPVIAWKDRLQTKEMHRDLRVFSRRFLTEEQLSDAAFMRWLKRDVWYSFLRYHCPIDEYFLYRFYRLSPTARREFVTDYEKDTACCAVNSAAVRNIMGDKGNTYYRFGSYFGRDVLPVDDNTTLADFQSFLAAHPRHIVKPRKDSCGRGVRLAEDTPPTEASLRAYQKEYAILEELIEQDEALARFHPGSVNTIRCATYHQNGGTKFLFTFLRIGQGSSIVDNGGAGGLIASIDIDTGVIITPGFTETNQCSVIHPDTGVQILGASIPRWEEMKALSAELSASFPECPYISWDLALTPKGWVVVEGNSTGQFVGPQLTLQRGMRRELSPYFDSNIDPE